MVSAVPVLVAPAWCGSCSRLLAVSSSPLPIVRILVNSNTRQVPFAPNPHILAAIDMMAGFGYFSGVQPAQQRILADSCQFSHFRRGITAHMCMVYTLASPVNTPLALCSCHVNNDRASLFGARWVMMAKKHGVTTRMGKNEHSLLASLISRLTPDLLAVVRGETIDLNNVSVFCRRQAECAASWESIVQIKPGVFTLKTPFRESFIGSLHCYVYPNMKLRPEETVAYAMVRCAEWYLRSGDVDALRERGGTHRIRPSALRGAMTCKEGIIRPTGEFTCDPEADGTPAVLAWQDNNSDPPGFAIEIRGPGVAAREPEFRRTLLRSMLDHLAVELRLKRPGPGRPSLAPQSEMAAYLRDHQQAGRTTIAKHLCSCGNSHHTQQCFDRLNKLADSFYRTQRFSFEKLVREHARTYLDVKKKLSAE